MSGTCSTVTICGDYAQRVPADPAKEGVPSPIMGCTDIFGAKFRAAAVRAVDKGKCHVRAVETNTPLAPTCVARADQKFATGFARAEAPVAASG